jgi:hypothetical protein
MPRHVPLMASWLMAGGAAQGWSPADPMVSATSAGEVFAFESDYVRVRYAVLEVPVSAHSTGRAPSDGHHA